MREKGASEVEIATELLAYQAAAFLLNGPEKDQDVIDPIPTAAAENLAEQMKDLGLTGYVKHTYKNGVQKEDLHYEHFLALALDKLNLSQAGLMADDKERVRQQLNERLENVPMNYVDYWGKNVKRNEKNLPYKNSNVFTYEHKPAEDDWKLFSATAMYMSGRGGKPFKQAVVEEFKEGPVNQLVMKNKQTIEKMRRGDYEGVKNAAYELRRSFKFADMETLKNAQREARIHLDFMAMTDATRARITKTREWKELREAIEQFADAQNNVDAIALLRPTASPGLFYQMCGRGFRIADGKDDCLILDFAGNLKLHGPVDAIEAPDERKKGKREPKNKTCPVCYESIPIQARSCPSCGTKLLCDDFLCPSCDATVDRSAFFCPSCGFQLRQRHSGDYDHVHSILSTNPLIEEKVVKTEYVIHRAKSGVDCLMVAYNTPYTRICEFVCFDHKGYARQKAARWWQERSTIFPVPVSTKQAWKIIDAYGIGEPTTIEYLPATPKDKYPRLQSSQVEPKRYDFHVSPTANPLGVVCECGAESFIYEHGASYRVICAKCGTCVLDSEVDDFDVRRVEFIESWENEFNSDEIPF